MLTGYMHKTIAKSVKAHVLLEFIQIQHLKDHGVNK